MSAKTSALLEATQATVVSGLPMPEFKHIRVEPMTGGCGAEIAGVDLREPLSEAVVEEIMRAFTHFLVITFRDQDLSPEQHKAFSRLFGPLTELPQAPIYPGHPDMQEVRREAHEPATVVPGSRFHTDSPFLPRPALCIVMRALDVPKYGGDTAFANMYAVYDSLSDGMKKTLSGLKIVYSAKDLWAKNKKLPDGERLRLRETHGFAEDQLESAHPAIRRHPETGRRALYVTQAYAKRIEGWSEEESRPLIDYLSQLPNRLAFQCRVRWRPNTLIVWDNRFAQHCGVHDYVGERRHLVRTTVIGEKPIRGYGGKA